MSIRLDPEKFSELPPTDSVDGSEIIPIVKDGENASVTVGNLWGSQDLSAYARAAGFRTITVGTQQPTDPQIGDLWVDTN